MQVFLHILTHNIVPIFILITVGFILGKNFKLDMKTLAKMHLYAFMPIFTFAVIYTNDLSGSISSVLIYSLLFLSLMYLAAFLIATIRKYEMKKKYAFVSACFFYNSGNIGIPLILLVFDGTPYVQDALIVQITIMLIQSMAINTIGFYNAGRHTMHWKDSLLNLLKLPAIYAIILALLLKNFDFRLETTFVWPAFEYIKDAMIGFILVTLGVQLASTEVTKIDSTAVLAVAVKLIGAPVLSYILIRIMNLEGALAQTLFISGGLPTAVNTVIIAVEQKGEAEFAAKTVMYSTLACVFTLIFVIYMARILFPLN